MSLILAFKFSVLIMTLKLQNAAKYEEEPFQKFTVLFQQSEKNKNSQHKHVTMNLRGETFHCSVPSDDFLQSLLKTPTLTNIGAMSKKISSMPCILAQDVLWLYLLCPDSDIQQFSRLFPLVRQSLGTKFTDDLSRETVRGVRDSGDRAVFTRRFTEGSWCDFDRKIGSEVRFYCRQDPKDDLTKVERVTPCEFVMHVHTRSACSGDNFESEHGYPLHCRSEKHVMEVLLPNVGKYTSFLTSSSQYSLVPSGEILPIMDCFSPKIDEPKPMMNDIDDVIREALDSHLDLSIVTDALSKGKLSKMFSKRHSGFHYDKLVIDEWKTTKEDEDEKIARKISYMKLGPSMIPKAIRRNEREKQIMRKISYRKLDPSMFNKVNRRSEEKKKRRIRR